MACAAAVAAALGLSAPAAASAGAKAPAPKSHAAKAAKAGSKASKAGAKGASKPEADKPEIEISDTAARVAEWVALSDDNGKYPYIIVDKPNARMFLFDASGKQVGDAPVLIGKALGDTSSPGVGAKKLAEIGTKEKTTPAGRFYAKFGRAVGEKVLWVDYYNSVAMHAVVTTNPKERRLQRINSPTSDDNRITFGCINVPTKFYGSLVRPMFQKKGGMVYVLPDVKPIDDVFPNLRMLPYLQKTAQENGGEPPEQG